MSVIERETFDWGDMEGSHDVQIGKVLANNLLQELESSIGHPLSVGNTDNAIAGENNA